MATTMSEYVHIVPVGLSLLTNAGWKEGEPLPPKRKLLDLLKENPRKMSAEMNALTPFIQRKECSAVHLIGTTAPAGSLCREVLGTFLKEQGIKLTLAEAKGLSPRPLDMADDQEAFYEAVRRFREQVFRVVQRARKRGAVVFINATGGLKAEVAVAALMAAEFSIPAYYIHQSMKEPVFLPTAALDSSVLSLLQKIARPFRRYDRCGISEADLRRLEREALVKISRRPAGEIGNVRLTKYGRDLLHRKRATSSF